MSIKKGSDQHDLNESAVRPSQVPQWIPVSERLPESQMHVLGFYLNDYGAKRVIDRLRFKNAAPQVSPLPTIAPGSPEPAEPASSAACVERPIKEPK